MYAYINNHVPVFHIIENESILKDDLYWCKVDTENGPLQCKIMFGGHHTFPLENTFACDPSGTIFCKVCAQIYALISLSVISKWIEIIFFSKKSWFLSMVRF